VCANQEVSTGARAHTTTRSVRASTHNAHSLLLGRCGQGRPLQEAEQEGGDIQPHRDSPHLDHEAFGSQQLMPDAVDADAVERDLTPHCAPDSSVAELACEAAAAEEAPRAPFAGLDAEGEKDESPPSRRQGKPTRASMQHKKRGADAKGVEVTPDVNPQKRARSLIVTGAVNASSTGGVQGAPSVQKRLLLGNVLNAVVEAANARSAAMDTGGSSDNKVYEADGVKAIKKRKGEAHPVFLIKWAGCAANRLYAQVLVGRLPRLRQSDSAPSRVQVRLCGEHVGDAHVLTPHRRVAGRHERATRGVQDALCREPRDRPRGGRRRR
jgi:hypothetical protein